MLIYVIVSLYKHVSVSMLLVVCERSLFLGCVCMSVCLSLCLNVVLFKIFPEKKQGVRRFVRLLVKTEERKEETGRDNLLRKRGRFGYS